MRNIRLRLQYEGTRYQGWQKQTSTDNTIQGKMEVLLTKMCGEPVEIAASGRTDAGVHALGQVANFHTESDMSTEEIMAYCNRYLPEDIAVVEVSEAAPRFHSRLNATGKRYRYRIINSQIPDVFWRRYAAEEPEALDLDAMRKAAERLLGEHDFKAFTSAKKSKKSTVRRHYTSSVFATGSFCIAFEKNFPFASCLFKKPISFGISSSSIAEPSTDSTAPPIWQSLCVRFLVSTSF